jgi:hypothetical protein
MNTLAIQQLTTLAGGEEITMLAIGGGLMIAIISIIMGTVKSTTRTKEREQSRREIAAYIAEGSMTPEDGRKLMDAGGRKSSEECEAKSA